MPSYLYRNAAGNLTVKGSGGNLRRSSSAGRKCCCCFTSDDGCFTSEEEPRVTAYNDNISGKFLRLRLDTDADTFVCGGGTTWHDLIDTANGSDDDVGILFKQNGADTCYWTSVEDDPPTYTEEDSISECECLPSFNLTPAPWAAKLRSAKNANIVIDAGSPADAAGIKKLVDDDECTSIIQIRIAAAIGEGAANVELSGQWDFLFGGPSGDDATSTPDDLDQNYITVYRSHVAWSCEPPGQLVIPEKMRLIVTDS